MTRAGLSYANLTEANLTMATLTRATLTGTNMTGVIRKLTGSHSRPGTSCEACSNAIRNPTPTIRSDGIANRSQQRTWHPPTRASAAAHPPCSPSPQRPSTLAGDPPFTGCPPAHRGEPGVPGVASAEVLGTVQVVAGS
ncbi:MAG: pentapeptide repeat-containing protein, partial [Actinomycetes bacterium]